MQSNRLAQFFYVVSLCSTCIYVYVRTSSYHPLLPAFRREDHSTQATPTPTTPTSTAANKPSPSTTGTSVNGASLGSEANGILVQPREELTDVNLDLVHALDIDFHHAMLPARPDILLLPSDLKPFAKVLSLSPSLFLSLSLSLSPSLSLSLSPSLSHTLSLSLSHTHSLSLSHSLTLSLSLSLSLSVSLTHSLSLCVQCLAGREANILLHVYIVLKLHIGAGTFP